MSQNFIQNEASISLSMMTFKDYYMNFIGIGDSQLADGWGWFIDIESNEQTKIKKSIYYSKPSQYILAQKTIQENHSIRSMKSMINLHDINIDTNNKTDDDNEDIMNKFTYINILTHTIGFIGLAIRYFVTW